MDLKFDSKLFGKKLILKTAIFHFHRKDMRGIPDKVIEGDGFAVEIKDNQAYLIDIFNSEKVLENLLKNIGLGKTT